MASIRDVPRRGPRRLARIMDPRSPRETDRHTTPRLVRGPVAGVKGSAPCRELPGAG